MKYTKLVKSIVKRSENQSLIANTDWVEVRRSLKNSMTIMRSHNDKWRRLYECAHAAPFLGYVRKGN